MSRITIHAGDFHAGKESRFNGTWLLAETGKRSAFFGVPKWEKIPPDQFEALEVATEESVKRLGGTIGWGAAGAVILGPVGLLAGLLAGGRGKKITFVLRLKDGRKMLASTDSKTFTKMQAACFR